MKIDFRAKRTHRFLKILILSMLTIFTAFLVGCVGTAMETHKQGMESGLGKEYFIPKKPIDRHFIGCAWSKQFGPIEDPATADIRVKVDKSFNNMQQNFAYNEK
jgi:hypothetical protein